MAIGVNVMAYNPTTSLLSSTFSNAFTGINAIAGLVSDRKVLQSGNYKRLLKEYYAASDGVKTSKKMTIKDEVKEMDKLLEKRTKTISPEEAKAQWEKLKKNAYDINGQYYVNVDQVDKIFEAFV